MRLSCLLCLFFERLSLLTTVGSSSFYKTKAYLFQIYSIIILQGLVGLLATPIFREDGLLATGSSSALSTLAWNAIGGAALLVYYALASVVLFVTLEKLAIFRVNAEDEIVGLDTVKHKEQAYLFGEQ